MKYFVLSCFAVLSVNLLVAQVSSSDEKKILKILGESFIQHDAISTYPFGRTDELSLVDTSIFVLGDTTGIHLNKEYLLFRDSIHFRNDLEYFSLVKAIPTSISEYQEFKNYVRDSIARLKLFYGLQLDYEAAEYVNCPKEKRGKLFGRYTVYNHDRVVSFERCGLNWKTKFSYVEMNCVPVLSDMYVPRVERFRNMRVFDERKFVYQQKDKLTCVWDDHLLWAKNASHDDDEFGILSQIYPQISEDIPVVGLLGTQAKAFCHWKQVNLQKEFNRLKLPFEVVVTLPVKEQLIKLEPINQFQIKSRDYTNQWRISNDEYAEFIDYVEDSILRTFLYTELILDELAIKFLQSEQRYFDELAYEFVDRDPSDRKFNLAFFPLSFDQKIREKHWDIRDALAKYENEKPKLVYRYSTIRTRAKARPPIMKLRKELGIFYSYESGEDKDLYRDSILECRRVYSYSWESTPNAGVSLIWSLDKFIAHHEVPVALEKSALSEDPNSLIPTLTYEQALAFYNWKYPIDKFNPKEENWQQFIYPSEEQFVKIQNGESIVIPEHEVEFPTPLFRYVVHIYRKQP